MVLGGTLIYSLAPPPRIVEPKSAEVRSSTSSAETTTANAQTTTPSAETTATRTEPQQRSDDFGATTTARPNGDTALRYRNGTAS